MHYRILSLPLMVLLFLGCGNDNQSHKTQRLKTQVDDRQYKIQVSAGEALRAIHNVSKRDEIVLLELYSDKIILTALISRRKYNEVMALNPPTYIKHAGREYVKNNLLFWGKPGKNEQVSVDGKTFDGFSLDASKTQIIAKGNQVEDIVSAMRSGKILKLEKHYWNDDNDKDFPVFDISDIRQDLTTLASSSESSFIVRESETRCKKYGNKKVVWLDNPAGIFALNGPAIELVESGSSNVPWVSGGRPVQLGRDILGSAITHELIQTGMKKCK